MLVNPKSALFTKEKTVLSVVKVGRRQNKKWEEKPKKTVKGSLLLRLNSLQYLNNKFA